MDNHPLEGGTGLGLGSAASTGEGQGGRTGDIFVQGREEWGLVPVNTLEWRQTSGRGNCGRIPPHRSCWDQEDHATKGGLHLLVLPLHLANGLGMEPR